MYESLRIAAETAGDTAVAEIDGITGTATGGVNVQSGTMVLRAKSGVTAPIGGGTVAAHATLELSGSNVGSAGDSFVLPLGKTLSGGGTLSVDGTGTGIGGNVEIAGRNPA